MRLRRIDNLKRVTHTKDVVPVHVPIRKATKLDPPENKVRFEIDQNEDKMEPLWGCREADLTPLTGERVFIDEDGYEIPESMVETCT
jgi:hypothetical protein